MILMYRPTTSVLILRFVSRSSSRTVLFKSLPDDKGMALIHELDDFVCL